VDIDRQGPTYTSIDYRFGGTFTLRAPDAELFFISRCHAIMQT
jgi:hypothetical protein